MKVVYLSGGVGGARLLEGMARVLAPEALTAIVNVGDDFEHLGLYVCPDLDTVLYTLAHLSDMKRGWGLRGETFRALELLKRYGGEDWFQLGDKDLALHVMRSAWRAQGERLRRHFDDQAIVELAKAVRLAPGNAVYHFHLGLAYAEAKEPAKARASLEQALQINPNFPGADEARDRLRSLTE